MTREDTLTIMGILKAAYPNFYRGMTRVDAETAVSLWQDMFSDDPVELVAAAVKVLIAADGKGYPPHIGAVKEKMRLIQNPNVMTEAEAWALVSKAVKRSGYNSAEEFEKLPDSLKRIVGSPNQLKEWAMIDADTLQTVVASNFQRSYRTVSAYEKEIAAIPESVKKAISGISNKLTLGSTENGS